MAEKGFQPLSKGRVIPDAVTVFTGASAGKGGAAFHGWESLSITKTLDSIAHAFSITLFDKFTGLKQDWPLKPGVRVHFHLGRDSVATGRIEKLEAQFSPDKREFTISGRSNAGDLVDACHDGNYELNGSYIEEIAKELCDPFGIRVSMALPKQSLAVEKFAVKPGETVFEALDRAARLHGALWISTVEGGIMLTRAGTTKAFSALEQNVNVLSASATYDDSKRHNVYKVKGQAVGKDEFAGLAASSPEGEATDKGVTRHRPLVLVSESSGDGANAQTRAEWEATHRLAQAIQVEVGVAGWRQANGGLWDINQIVRIKSGFLGLDRQMLISAITYEVSNSGGTTANLTLVDKNAFTPKPETNTKASDDIFSGIGNNDEDEDE